MGYILGGSQVTRFSWIDYQALMLILAAITISTILFVEQTLKSFQVLPLLFPGMFSVSGKRFHFFRHDISGGRGKKIRGEAKMILRITLIGVLSYLWHHCVIETTQQVGKTFPTAQCEVGQDCFASEFGPDCLFNRRTVGVDCNAEHKDFSQRMVVSCIRFVPPTASSWLMHLAISYSVTQLSFKAFELLVWIGGGSLKFRRFLIANVFMGFITFGILYFVGLWTDFESTFFSFVMSLTIPLFFHSVYKCSVHLEQLWQEDAARVQGNIEDNMNDAFKDIADAVRQPYVSPESLCRPPQNGATPKGSMLCQIKNKIQTMRGSQMTDGWFTRSSTSGIARQITPPGSVAGKTGKDTGSDAAATLEAQIGRSNSEESSPGSISVSVPTDAPVAPVAALPSGSVECKMQV